MGRPSKRRSTLPRLATVACLTVTATLGWAVEPVQDLPMLQRLAEDYAREMSGSLPGRVVIAAAPLDSRLRLRSCDAIERFIPRGGKLWGSSHVGLHCKSPQEWTVLVPVTVEVFGSAVFSARALSPGQPLSTADLQTRDVDLTELPASVIPDASVALGKVLRIGIGPGQPLRTDMLRSQTLITHGRQVTILYRSDGLMVRSAGKAVGDAGLGETLQVRTESGKIVRGVVIGPQEVEIR